jgi:hypothetical protein
VPGKYVAGARKVCRGHHGARGRRVGQAWSRKCESLDVLQPYGLSWLAREIALSLPLVKSDISGLCICSSHRVNKFKKALWRTCLSVLTLHLSNGLVHFDNILYVESALTVVRRV